LTLPPGRPGKNLPLVVMPHDGPALVDLNGFNWWAQALASQGYSAAGRIHRPQERGPLAVAWHDAPANAGGLHGVPEDQQPGGLSSRPQASRGATFPRERRLSATRISVIARQITPLDGWTLESRV
jgi:hypothetical protein